MANNLVGLLQLLSQFFSLLILARVLMSWVQVDRDNVVIRGIYNLTEPILAPLRRILPQVGMFDFSPIVAMLLLDLLLVPILTVVIRSILR